MYPTIISTNHLQQSGSTFTITAVGVEPSAQGKGIGGALMRPILRRAGAERLPCYLETQNKRNLPFYERHGFEVVSDGEVPKRGLPVLAIVRDPHSANPHFADTP